MASLHVAERRVLKKMRRAKRDDYIDIRSVHEVGHAIAAIRMRVRFSYVSIEYALLPGTGGHTMVTLPLHNGTLNSIRRLLVVLFAGASAADHILKLDGSFYDTQIAGDLVQIKATVAAHSKLFPAHARHQFVRDCRSHAEAMVRIPFVEQAIRDVAIALELRKRLSANQVKRIYEKRTKVTSRRID
jgi:hypothetical protein